MKIINCIRIFLREEKEENKRNRALLNGAKAIGDKKNEGKGFLHTGDILLAWTPERPPFPSKINLWR